MTARRSPIAREALAVLLVGAALALPAPTVSAQTLTPAPLRRAEIAFAIKATTVSDFVGRVDSVRAQFSGNSLAAVTGWVEFHVRDMHTGIGLRDRHMRNAMNADSFPTVRFELVGLDLGGAHGDSITATFQGSLTIHGVTKTIRAPGSVVVHGDEADVTASFPIDMREYGIPPPSRFFGAVKVDPTTGIVVKLVFGR